MKSITKKQKNEILKTFVLLESIEKDFGSLEGFKELKDALNKKFSLELTRKKMHVLVIGFKNQYSHWQQPIPEQDKEIQNLRIQLRKSLPLEKYTWNAFGQSHANIYIAFEDENDLNFALLHFDHKDFNIETKISFIDNSIVLKRFKEESKLV